MTNDETSPLLPATALAAVGAILATASPAAAVPLTSYEMPFPCGESWTGTTRASHSPSSSLDRLEPPRRRRRPGRGGRRGRGHHGRAQRHPRLRPLRRGRPRQRRVDAVRPPPDRQRRRRPDRRPGQPARPAGRDRQRHRTPPALRGAAQRQDRGALLPRREVRLRHRAAVAELPRRAAGRKLRRRRHRRAGGLRPGHRHLPDQPAHGADRRSATALGTDQPVVGDWDGDGTAQRRRTPGRPSAPSTSTPQRASPAW